MNKCHVPTLIQEKESYLDVSKRLRRKIFKILTRSFKLKKDSHFDSNRLLYRTLLALLLPKLIILCATNLADIMWLH